MTEQVKEKKNYKITEKTAVSLGVVAIIVSVSLFIFNIKSNSDANAIGISDNQRMIIENKRQSIEYIKSLNSTIQNMNSRIGRIEGMLEEMKRNNRND